MRTRPTQVLTLSQSEDPAVPPLVLTASATASTI